MPGAARSPSPATPPPAACLRRRRAARIGAALLLLAVIAWGGFTWLFYDPFEGTVERLDRVIPASVGFAVRGSFEELRAAAFVKDRLLARPEAEDLLRSWNFEDALRGISDGQERLDAGLPSFVGGFDIRRELFARETAVFGSVTAGTVPPVFRGAVATRLSRKARMGLSLLKHEWMRRRAGEQSGAKITRFPLYYEVDLSTVATVPEWSTAWGALAGDILIFGNDRALVAEAAHLAVTGGSGSLPERQDAGTAFTADSTSPLRGWVDLVQLGRDRSRANQPTLGEAAAMLEGLPGLAAEILDPDAVSTAQVAVRFPSRDEADLEVSGVRGAGSTGGIADALGQGRARSGAEALKEAAMLAPAGSAVAALRLEVTAGSLLRTLYGRVELPIREEADKALHEATTSLDDIAREVDDYLEPGASIVVERLPECDSIALDTYGADPQGRFVLPLPGLLLVMRQRAAAGDGAAERFLRKWIDRWKERFEGYEDLAGLPEGVRGFRFRPKLLTGEKELVRPAAAFQGDLVLLATNEGTLRRALDARAGKLPALTDFEGFAADAVRCGEGQGFAFVEAGAALKMLRDGRREWATARVQFDAVEERRRLFSKVATEFIPERHVVTQKEIEDEVDRRMAERERVQREVEFPRAVEEYARGLKALEGLRSLAGGLSWDSSGFRLALTVRTGE